MREMRCHRYVAANSPLPNSKGMLTGSSQGRRDDNISTVFVFEGVGHCGQRGKSWQNAGFRGKRHDN